MTLREFFTNNRWWGKIIGAILGYLLAGSAGALFGILIGNLFDRSMLGHYSRPLWYYHVEKRQQIQRVFFEATFSIMGHIAKADGRVSQREIDMATTLMNDMGLNREQKKGAQKFFNEGKAATFNLGPMLDRLKANCHDNPELLKLFMDIQYRSALTDGFSEKKINTLDIIFRRMGFAPLREQYRFYEDFRQQTAYQRHESSNQRSHHYNHSRPQQSSYNSLAHAYAILELDPSANKQETKKAYRRLISRNHPDKLIAQGLPEAMIKIANEKTQQITKAYEQICVSKGW